MRERVASLIANRGSEASWPIFLEATHDARGEVRLLAYRGLAQSATQLDKLIPVLIAAAGDEQEDVRVEAAHGLASIPTRWSYRLPNLSAGESRTLGFEALRRLVKDPSPRVRVEAVAALAWYAPEPAAIADLVQAAGDADHAVRFAAAQALLKVNGPGDRSAGQVLIALVSDPSPLPNRREIMDVLLNTTDETLNQAAAALTKLLSNRDPLIIPEVIDWLSAAGVRARAAIPALERLWNDPRFESRIDAGMAIVAIEGRPSLEQIENTTAPGMAAGSMMASMMAASVTAGSAPAPAWQPSPRATKILVSIVSDSTLTLNERELAIPWLRGAGAQVSAKATPDLIRQLTHQNAQVRLDAVSLLTMMIDLTPAEIPAVESKERH